jgi:invasion protein IalB
MGRREVAAVALLALSGQAGAGTVSLDMRYTPHEERAVDAAWGVAGAVGYRRFEDGSAWFRPMLEGETPAVPKYELHSAARGWSVSCSVDAMTDAKHCRVSQQTVRVAVLGPRCEVGIAVGTEHFPGTSSLVRLDTGPPITTSARDGVFDVKAGILLVARMKKAKTMVTRHTEWPSRAPVDTEIDLKGFLEAADYACWAVKRLRK